MHYHFIIHYITPACLLYHHRHMARLQVLRLCQSEYPTPSQWHPLLPFICGEECGDTPGCHKSMDASWASKTTSPRMILSVTSGYEHPSHQWGPIQGQFPLRQSCSDAWPALITYAPVSIVTKHGMPSIWSPAFRLLLTCLANMLSV
jgi:hypothetical protein